MNSHSESDSISSCGMKRERFIHFQNFHMEILCKVRIYEFIKLCILCNMSPQKVIQFCFVFFRSKTKIQLKTLTTVTLYRISTISSIILTFLYTFHISLVSEFSFDELIYFFNNCINTHITEIHLQRDIDFETSFTFESHI